MQPWARNKGENTVNGKYSQRGQEVSPATALTFRRGRMHFQTDKVPASDNQQSHIKFHYEDGNPLTEWMGRAVSSSCSRIEATAEVCAEACSEAVDRGITMIHSLYPSSWLASSSALSQQRTLDVSFFGRASDLFDSSVANPVHKTLISLALFVGLGVMFLFKSLQRSLHTAEQRRGRGLDGSPSSRVNPKQRFLQALRAESDPGRSAVASWDPEEENEGGEIPGSTRRSAQTPVAATVGSLPPPPFSTDKAMMKNWDSFMKASKTGQVKDVWDSGRRSKGFMGIKGARGYGEDGESAPLASREQLEAMTARVRAASSLDPPLPPASSSSSARPGGETGGTPSGRGESLRDGDRSLRGRAPRREMVTFEDLDQDFDSGMAERVARRKQRFKGQFLDNVDVGQAPQRYRRVQESIRPLSEGLATDAPPPRSLPRPIPQLDQI